MRAIVPEFALADRDAAERVTLRHLLSHAGGWIGEELPSSFDGGDALARAAAACGTLPQLTRPGALFSYNNTGFGVAGRVVEVAAGRPFEEVVREMLLSPLGMTRTAFAMPADANVAAEHTVRDGAPAVIEPWGSARSGAPVGGLRSTIRDLLRYARLHLAGARSVMSAPRAAQLAEPQLTRGWEGAWIALPWFLDERDGIRVLSHEGATVTHMSLLALVPARRAALAVLTNGANGGRVTKALLRDWLERLGLPAPAEPAPRAFPAEHVRERAGRYAWPTSDIDLVPEGDGLGLRITWKGSVAARPPAPPVHLAFAGPDAVVAMDGPVRGARGDFPRDGGGAVAFFRWGSRARPRAS